MNNWETVELGEIVKLGGGKIHTGPFGSQLHASDYVEQGIPCIMPANMVNNRVDVSSIAMISEADAERLSKYIVFEGDIVYSRRGDVTLKALIREQESGYFCGTGCLLLRPGSKVDSEFLTYYLSTDTMKWWIRQQAVGATMPNLNTGILARIPFRAPSKEEQSALARVISSLDKKIELNNKINAELEAMAKLIYDYWFVQFDFPDVNGKPYKSSGGKMVFNEELQREIPEGWQATTLGAICDLYQPKTISEKEMDENGKYLVYGANGVVGKYSQFNHEKSVVTITCRGNSCGTLNTTRPFSWITGNAMVVNNKCETMHVEFIHNMLSWSNLDAVISGSAQPQITRTNLAPLRLLLPPKSILAEYNKTISSNFEKRLILANENDQLISLRDWLLPMLMNGQVTISTK